MRVLNGAQTASTHCEFSQGNHRGKISMVLNKAKCLVRWSLFLIGERWPERGQILSHNEDIPRYTPCTCPWQGNFRKRRYLDFRLSKKWILNLHSHFYWLKITKLSWAGFSFKWVITPSQQGYWGLWRQYKVSIQLRYTKHNWIIKKVKTVASTLEIQIFADRT